MNQAGFVVPIEVRFKDIDGLGHVNNASYLTFLEHARMTYFTSVAKSQSERDVPFILVHAALDYKMPIRLNDKVEILFWTSRIGQKSWDFEYEIRAPDTHELYATCKTVQVAYDYELDESCNLEGTLKDCIKRLQRHTPAFA